MKRKLRLVLLLIGLASLSPGLFPQCEVLNRVAPDGSMQYYIEPVNFYWTEVKSLKGGIVTDKESYFLQLYPIPFPPKPEGQKLRKAISMELSNEITYELKHYDTRYISNDTIMEMLYLIDMDDLEHMLNYEVNSISLDMGDEGIRIYNFQLHKSALKEQLNCFLKEEDKEEKEKK